MLPLWHVGFLVESSSVLWFPGAEPAEHLPVIVAHALRDAPGAAVGWRAEALTAPLPDGPGKPGGGAGVVLERAGSDARIAEVDGQILQETLLDLLSALYGCRCKIRLPAHLAEERKHSGVEAVQPVVIIPQIILRWHAALDGLPEVQPEQEAVLVIGMLLTGVSTPSAEGVRRNPLVQA